MHMTPIGVVQGEKEERLDTTRLFQVWIDTNMGIGEPHWWWNDDPCPLREALEDAARCRSRCYPTLVMPEGMNPRRDGNWDNPA